MTVLADPQAREYVCDCGRTKVTVEEPAEYPYSDERQTQCTECGTYPKHYDFEEVSG